MCACSSVHKRAQACTCVHKCAQVCTCVQNKCSMDFRVMFVGCSIDVRYVRRFLVAGRYVDSPWMFRRHSLDLQRIWSVAICWSSSAVTYAASLGLSAFLVSSPNMWQQRSKAIAYGYQPRGNPTQPVNKSQIATNTEDDGNALNALVHNFMAFHPLAMQADRKLELITLYSRLFDEVNGTGLVSPTAPQAMSHTLKQNKLVRFSDELSSSDDEMPPLVRRPQRR